MLTGHHLGDLAGLEIGDLDLATDHVDAGLAGGDGDAKLGALHHSGEIRRLDLEMLDVALFDLEQDRAGLLHDCRRQPFLLFGGYADHRIRRHEDGLFAAPEEYTSGTAGADGIARLHEIFMLHRGLLNAGAGEPDLARRFADDPVVTVGSESGGGGRQDERCREYSRDAVDCTHETLRLPVCPEGYWKCFNIA